MEGVVTRVITIDNSLHWLLVIGYWLLMIFTLANDQGKVCRPSGAKWTELVSNYRHFAPPALSQHSQHFVSCLRRNWLASERRHVYR
jgi:hypothetical protein